MGEAGGLAAAIQVALPEIKSGTLRLFGQWFGRPYDNIHRVVGAEVEADCVVIRFNQGETLRVWQPAQWQVSAEVFQIGRAARVLWEWYHYGKPREPKYLKQWSPQADNSMSPAVELVEFSLNEQRTEDEKKE